MLVDAELAWAGHIFRVNVNKAHLSCSYVNKPLEKIVMCRDPSQEEMSEVETEVRRLVSQALEFLGEHRYDLVEVYGPEYQEFCAGLPDPNTEPRQILLDFLDVLNNLGEVLCLCVCVCVAVHVIVSLHICR